MSMLTYDDDSFPKTKAGCIALLIAYSIPFLFIAAFLIWLFW